MTDFLDSNGSRAEDAVTGSHADVSAGRLLRDFIAFELKLLVDGLKDFALSQLALLALVIELLFRRGRRGRLFYALMKVGARFESWLALYEPLSRTTSSDDLEEGVAARFGDANRILREAEARIFKAAAGRTPPD